MDSRGRLWYHILDPRAAQLWWCWAAASWGRILGQLERMTAPMVSPASRMPGRARGTLETTPELMGRDILRRTSAAAGIAALRPLVSAFPAATAAGIKERGFQMERKNCRHGRTGSAQAGHLVLAGAQHGQNTAFTCLTRDSGCFPQTKRVDAGTLCVDVLVPVPRVRQKQEWLDAAKSCLDFLEEHCINRTADRLYFTR